MVFQPSDILNPHLSDSPVLTAKVSYSLAVAVKASLTSLGAVIAALLISATACLADGFPGKGNPHDWSAALPYYNLANRYMQKERYEDAITKYEEAIAKYEYDPDFYVNLGVAWRKIENFAAAEAAFKKAAELNAKDWMSWSNLANSYLKQDRLEDTIKAFETALKCNPPPEEKQAILKDIADIKKILSVRSGFVQPPKTDTPPAKILTGTKAAHGGLVKQNARPGHLAAPKKHNELKDTGWDEVAK